MPPLPSLHASPAAGFDQPFELLAACHGRMVRTLALLARLGAHIAAQGCDAQARDAAADILRYFDIAAPLHHEDEELHVLPRLRAQGQGALADQLLAEHREMELAWAGLRVDLLAIQDASLNLATLAEARARWARFEALYGTHMQAEDGEAYPRAIASMAEAEARAMGQEMARRRGVRYPDPDPAA